MTKKDFHLHSNYSDGANSLEQIIKAGLELGYSELGFAEHIRRDCLWLDDYVKDMAGLKKKYQNRVKLWAGAEAKPINLQADLDYPLGAAAKLDFIIASVHRLPKGQNDYLEDEQIRQEPRQALELWQTIIKVLCQRPDFVIFGHLGYKLVQQGLVIPVPAKNRVATLISRTEKIVEINVRAGLPDEQFLSILQKAGVKFMINSDAHCLADLEKASQVYEELFTKYVQST